MSDIRLIAFYLPQFHPIGENNDWWGRGFTEWTNVASAKPVFPGHYQPHLPADLGFYDLRLPEAREEQAELARAHGIHGFCYYYYYFNGKKLLNRPLDDVIRTRKPDFPFCVCWANENWTRRWDGYDNEILIEQTHSVESDKEFIKQLLPVLNDNRYIRISNKLLLLVYRVELLHQPVETAKIWREIVRKEIGAELFLCVVTSHIKRIEPRDFGFDGSVQFPYDYTPDCLIDPSLFAAAHGINDGNLKDHLIINYPSVVSHFIHFPKPDHLFFRGVFPSWDNTPRRQHSSSIFINDTPDLYKLFLKATIALTNAEHKGEEKLIFINAWNEWAEGAYLEPDRKYGLRYLQVTNEALNEENDFHKIVQEVAQKDRESKVFFNEAHHLKLRVLENEKSITELSRQIDDRDCQLVDFKKELEQQALIIFERDHTIRDQTQQLQHKENIIQEKNIQIVELSENSLILRNQMQQLESILVENHKLIGELSRRVDGLSAELLTVKEGKKELEASIIEQQHLSRVKDQLLIKQKEEIQIRDQLLIYKDLAISDQENVISEHLRMGTELSHQIIERNQEIDRLKNSYLDSFSWKITKPLRYIHKQTFRAFYVFFPYGSRRWAFVKAVSRYFHVSDRNRKVKKERTSHAV